MSWKFTAGISEEVLFVRIPLGERALEFSYSNQRYETWLPRFVEYGWCVFCSVGPFEVCLWRKPE